MCFGKEPPVYLFSEGNKRFVAAGIAEVGERREYPVRPIPFRVRVPRESSVLATF
jgi:hypothetical protein